MPFKRCWKAKRKAPAEPSTPTKTEEPEVTWVITCNLLHENARLPEKATRGASGWDLTSIDRGEIPSGGRARFRTGITLQLPSWLTGILKSRSGMSYMHGIEVGAGVIDSDYEGQIIVILHNHGAYTYQVSAGDRIAQLILYHKATALGKDLVFAVSNDSAFPGSYLPVDSSKEYDRPVRGIRGFGSTGAGLLRSNSSGEDDPLQRPITSRKVQQYLSEPPCSPDSTTPDTNVKQPQLTVRISPPMALMTK